MYATTYNLLELASVLAIGVGVVMLAVGMFSKTRDTGFTGLLLAIVGGASLIVTTIALATPYSYSGVHLHITGKYLSTGQGSDTYLVNTSTGLAHLTGSAFNQIVTGGSYTCTLRTSEIWGDAVDQPTITSCATS